MVAVAVAIGVLPARGSIAAAGAVFPFDVYFDVKHALVVTSSWFGVVLVLLVSFGVRSAVLAATMWLADEVQASPRVALRTAIELVARTGVMFVPVAVLFVAGSAVRYAPFMWVAAPLGLGIALLGIRKAVAMDAGGGSPGGDTTPEAAPFLGYAYVVAGSAAAISFIGDRSSLLAALLIASIGPLHALFLLGWRENARAEVYPGGGFVALTATVAVVGMLAGATVYDRVVHSPTPVSRTRSQGAIALLGGADSTHRTGALSELDVRSLGYPEERARLLSYGTGSGYRARETRVDLGLVAERVTKQLASLREIDAIVGHSQAALIVDRMLDDGVDLPPRVVNLAPPPPAPPHLSLPEPGRSAVGRPAADAARALAGLLGAVGLPDFDIDAPASPTNLDPVVVPTSNVGRLAVWPLADSVWLDGDWRRPGEVNVVAVTDHVGVTNNGVALEAARDFLAGRAVLPDIGTWRGILVPVIRYAFEPWRPENR